MADTDSWDSDPDFLLPPGPFSLFHISSGGSQSSDQDEETESSSAGASALFSGPGGGSGRGGADDIEWGDEDEDGSLLKAVHGASDKEELDQSSTESRNGTIKALMSSFSGLSLASSPTTTITPSNSPFVPTSPSTTDPSTPLASPLSDHLSSNKMTTLRLSSSLSALIASATSGPGRVVHLGSTPQGRATSWDRDLDLDLDLGEEGLPIDLGQRRQLRGKGSHNSFSSHISDDPEDEKLLLPPSASKTYTLPTPKTSAKKPYPLSSTSSNLYQQGSPSKFSGTSPNPDREQFDEDVFDESDFDLPTDLAQVTLSPLLTRPSMTSLLSSTTHSRAGSSSTLNVHLHPSSTLATRPPSSLSLFPPLTSPVTSSRGDETSAEDDDEMDKMDEAFFDDLVLPSYFLGGPGNVTPPSDGELGMAGGKIDLQAMLKRKLEAREQSTASAASGTGTLGKKKSGLEGFREGHNEDAEAGLEVEGVKLGMDKIRTRFLSTPASTLRSGIKNIGSGSRATSTSSTSSSTTTTTGTVRRPAAPNRSTSSATVVPATPPPSSKHSPPRRPTSTSTTQTAPIPRSATTSSLARTSATSIGLGRPSSAQGMSARERRAAGPPPAPSTVMRDRVRTRTVSSTPSNASSTSSSVTMAPRRTAPRIDTSKSLGDVPMTLSPVVSSAVFPPPPTTPTPASSSRAPPQPHRELRSKKSAGHLLSTPATLPSGSKTLERKRSLQNLSSLSLDHSTHTNISKRPLRSPTPGGSSAPGSPLATYTTASMVTPRAGRTTPTIPSSSAFARPTAASASRVRERVVSGPSTPTSASLPPRQTTSFSRPSSAAGSCTPTRLTKPTLASASKARVLPSSATMTRIPSAPLTLSKPKRARQYGDGTELDEFDDLPTNKEKEMRSSLGPSSPIPAVAAKKRLVKRDGSASSISSVKTARGGSVVASRGGRTAGVVEGREKRVRLSGDELSPAGSLSPTISLATASATKKKKRKEPQLIQHRGPVVPKGAFFISLFLFLPFFFFNSNPDL